MEIQDEAPLPLLPLADLDEDYGHAVLHLAWDRHTETNERTLLFAFVELLPKEIPPPIDDYDPRDGERLGGQSKHCVYVRHAVTSARRALEWYLDCRAGTAVLPENDGAIPAAGDAKKTLKLCDLGEEPPWPGLISASDDTDLLPFVPGWIKCPRTHHLLPLADFDHRGLWSKEEQEMALSVLTDRLHFDLGDYPEYWGSAHLVAPNPVYREHDANLEAGKDPRESVLLRFQPRAGKVVDGLRVLSQSKDGWGVTGYRWITVRRPWLRIHEGGLTADTPEDIFDPRRGFLKVSNYKRAFVRSISIGVHVGGQYQVSAGNSSFHVARAGRRSDVRVDLGRAVENVASAHGRLRDAHFSRKKRNAAERHQQRWFRGQRDDARDYLRGMIHEAHSSVLFVDPYFGAEEVGEFMLAVGLEDVPIRILTSAEVLRELVSAPSHFERGEQLLDVVRQLERHKRMNPVEIRVMMGSRPAIHDRFLVIDERVWLLGSSLNEFGVRGTMMVGLPDPAPVREAILSVWNDAEALDTWVERRRGSRRGEEQVR